MIYKIGNIADLTILPSMDPDIKRRITALARMLSGYYGEDRDVENFDGGYILYSDHGTTPEELRKVFDYTAHTVEYVTCDYHTVPPIITAHYIINNEFTVSIIMSMADAPDEIRNEM